MASIVVGGGATMKVGAIVDRVVVGGLVVGLK